MKDSIIYAPPNTTEESTASEVGTQEIFTNTMMTIFSNDTKIRFYDDHGKVITAREPQLLCLLTAKPEDSHKNVPFGMRKPDIVSYPICRTGVNAIVMIGDMKRSEKTDNRDFTDAEVGHVLDMSIELLDDHQPWRSEFICFLSDSRRFQFFRLVKVNSEVIVESSSVFNSLDGWRIMLHLSTCELSSLGYENLAINNVQCSKLIGRSMQKFVFEGTYLVSSRPVIIKLYFDEEAHQREKDNLMIINQQTNNPFTFHIPELIESSLKTMSNKSCLILYPQCYPVQPCKYGEFVCGEDIAKLVEVVRWVHQTCSLAHRDIKPSNIFIRITESKRGIFLNDFGSAAALDVDTMRWEGTIGYYKKPESVYKPTVADDLIALARSTYVML
jgi:hypothetical protein